VTAATWARLARLARLAGWLTVALSLAFLAARLGQIEALDLITARWRPLALAIGAGALAYAAAGFLLAEAWRRLLGPGNLSPAAHHAVYGRTQIAKYLPGNCFHFAGRQWLGARLGHGQAALAVASIAETLLLIAIALTLALPLTAPWLPPTRWPWLLMAATVALALAWAGWRWPGLPGRTAVARATAGLARQLPWAVGCQLGFFAVCGALVWLLAGVVAQAPLDPPTAIGAFALAWVAGLIVPGAAAGIGVREAALTLTLAPSLGAEAATALAVALRLVTTLGDGLFFAAALLLPAPPAQGAPAAPPSP
jgi:hypothetical protein